jgi:two-component system OmpR family response regulator/two-component system alkaline phosphatase synthesis response regulator PhoP
MESRKVLVVDDEESILKIVDFALREEGYEVATAPDAEVACELMDEFQPDLIVLDIMLPERSGYDFCREVRQKSETPIIFLSARSEELDRVLGLELGADDYVTKPFSPRELVSRVRAHLRRAGIPPQPATGPINVGNLQIDSDSYQVSVNGQPVHLTTSEFRILEILAQQPGKVYSRMAMLEHLWKGGFVGDERTIDFHIHNLREKIEPNPRQPAYVLTVRGLGYRLVEP